MKRRLWVDKGRMVYVSLRWNKNDLCPVCVCVCVCVCVSVCVCVIVTRSIGIQQLSSITQRDLGL